MSEQGKFPTCGYLPNGDGKIFYLLKPDDPLPDGYSRENPIAVSGAKRQALAAAKLEKERSDVDGSGRPNQNQGPQVTQNPGPQSQSGYQVKGGKVERSGR